MDLIPLTSHAYQLRGGSNAGLIVQDGRGVLVDTGLDRDTAKKILRHVETLHIKLVGVIITHAHADHFGGAATIRGRTGAPVYASGLEAAIVANPILEPLYLFSGAAPVAELRHKFTLAEPCPVDRVLEPGETAIDGVPVRVIPAAGHAPEQIMIAGGDVCFVADACFAPDILHKHGIPFYVDIDQTLTTLKTLDGLDGSYATFMPGHGPAVSQIAPWAAENAARLIEIRAAVADMLTQAEDVNALVTLTANRLGVGIPNPVIYWLTQTTVLACLSSLQHAGKVSVQVIENRLTWKLEAGNR